MKTYTEDEIIRAWEMGAAYGDPMSLQDSTDELNKFLKKHGSPKDPYSDILVVILGGILIIVGLLMTFS